MPYWIGPQFYNDGCPIINDSDVSRTANSSPIISPNVPIILADGQQYALYPNPNDGNFTVVQGVIDNNPVTAEIRDVVGQSIYKGSLQFSNGVSKLNIASRAQGIYLLELRDSQGRTFIFKFVVE